MPTPNRSRSSWRARRAVLVLALAFAGFPGSGGPSPQAASSARLPSPEDRYALAGGCYAVRSLAAGKYVARRDGGFAATAAGLGGAEPFTFQATDLGRYLLYGTAEDYVAADPGLIGTLTETFTGSLPGSLASGLSTGATDRVAEALAESALAVATGRGSAVVAAAGASSLADWEIMELGGGAYTIRLPAIGKVLAVDSDAALVLVSQTEAGDRAGFAFGLTDGCTPYPEVEINIEGAPSGGPTAFGEVRGFLDTHLHAMAFEFIGGRSRCGRPWHPYGVAYALVDCPDHLPGGQGAVLEAALTNGSSATGHDTVGWPTFGYWPKYNSLTHEQIYYKWLERAWRGGLRMYVNLLVDNHALCTIYPFKAHGCNEMDGVRLQAQRARELERYIDAQSGGPGEGWYRIVGGPFEARRVINEGKLAVVLGIEVSILFDCGLILDVPQCNEQQIDERLEEVHALGVRQMELVNKFDNALSGVTGDGGSTGLVVNTGNKTETGFYWRMETCGEEVPEGASDNTQYNIHDHGGTPDALTSQDGIFGAVLETTGTSGVAPIYPQGPHCNVVGLSPLGEHLIRRMMDKGMIFDPDHMSARARHQAMDIIEAAGYSGVVSSHSWADDTIYPRVYKVGGVVTPYAGGSEGFVAKWRQHKQWADERYYFGFGFGSDVNGFGSQGAPRNPKGDDKVTYPFAGFGGVVVNKQRSGERVYDINSDGVAHYGLYPDWIEDLRRQAGDEIVEDMERGPEAYLQMWERAIGVAAGACRADVADLSDARVRALQPGMSTEDVLWKLGQPSTRQGTQFRFCASGGRTVTLTFTPGGLLERVSGL